MPKKGGRGDGFMGVKALADRFKDGMPKANRPNNYKGKLISEPDKYEEGKYVPWARGQKIGSVKEVLFDAEGRRGYLGGFRKRKTERVTVAKKSIVDKDEAERRKEKSVKKRHMLDAYDARMEQMKALADGVGEDDQPRAKGRKGRKGAALDSDDYDSEEEEEEEEELETGGINSGPLPAQAAPHGPSKLSFGDRAVGTGTIVEVEEMDMSELLRGAASSTLLPALPKPDGPMSNRLKKKIKGPQRRQLKKDKLQKTKRSIRGDKVKKAKGKS
ncbi:hypothetical protein T484DRAFT_1913500 [Baffinella frigidus]|nr:hypothetical protein T484DRAFT_1913500 [Cryptophyta sp. CCMP2293]